MSKIQARSMAEQLMDMNYDDFRVVCEEDIKLADRGEMDELTFDALREPPVIQRFYSMLSQMQKSVEGQLAAGRAEMKSRTAKMRLRNATAAEYQEAVAKHENWRAGALRFKTGCEQRMAEIAGLLREADMAFFADRVKEERNDALARVKALEDAIRTHRDHVCNDEAGCQQDRSCAADEDLWGLVI
jgi:hypothetical protein